MKTIIKLLMCLSMAITYFNVNTMMSINRTPIKTRFINLVSTALDTAKLRLFKHSQEELDNMLLKATLIDPDHKIRLIKKLIDLGANVNVEINNLTPLIGAIAGGYMGENIKTIDLLLKSGANVAHATPSVGSPLKFAQIAQNSDIVIKLLERAIENKKTKDQYVQ